MVFLSCLLFQHPFRLNEAGREPTAPCCSLGPEVSNRSAFSLPFRIFLYPFYIQCPGPLARVGRCVSTPFHPGTENSILDSCGSLHCHGLIGQWVQKGKWAFKPIPILLLTPTMPKWHSRWTSRILTPKQCSFPFQGLCSRLQIRQFWFQKLKSPGLELFALGTRCVAQ